MAAKTNLIKTADIQVTAREIDFVTRFERNWEHLREILGIMRPIKKQPGAILKSKYAEGSLEDGNVGEGEEIPYSKFTVKEKEYAEMTIEKYAKAVSMHWWTFLGYYMEIGECTLATIVSIRDKKRRGKKLEKWEQEYYRNNKKLIDLKTEKVERSEEEKEELRKLFGLK